MLRLTYAVPLLAVVACAGESTAPGSRGGGGGGGKADGDQTTLTFADDYTESADGPITAGSTVIVEYDLDRVTECRGRTNGSDVWAAAGYASFDGGEPVSFAVSQITGGTTRAVAAELQIPADVSSVELWFTSSNRWGCQAYDSNDGDNYAFDVEAQREGAVLSFDADFTQSIDGELVAGDKVVVHYDPARLSACEGTQGGLPQWSITGYYKADNGTVKYVSVTRADGPDLVAADPSITVPRGERLSLWFEAVSTYGCHELDSNFGANYTYEID